MRVPFVDVAAATAEIRDEIDAALRRVVDSGHFVLGGEVEAFEQEFATYCGVRCCVGVGNGLDALSLILRGLGIGPGDEVLVPAQTFIATWLAVSLVGASPVPVDVLEESGGMDPELARRAVGPRTRAIIAVHLFGHCVDVERLSALAQERGLELIEDAAQAHGAQWQGRRAGSLGRAAAFSFYPTKNLGALGDAGAVVTDDEALAARVRALRNYGSSRKYAHDVQGVNSRLDPLQAAVLRVKLPRLDEWNARRRRWATRCAALVETLPGLALVTPHAGDSVWHLLVVRHPARDALQAALAQRGIETLVHYPVAPHRSGAFEAFRHWSLPVAERLANTALSLPMYPQLSEPAMTAVEAALREAVQAVGPGRHGS